MITHPFQIAMHDVEFVHIRQALHDVDELSNAESVPVLSR